MQDSHAPTLTALDHLVLTVSDTATSIAFYTSVLGMRHDRFAASDGRMREALHFGAQKINLHPADAPFVPHAKTPAPGAADLCFLTDTDIGAWQAHLESAGVEIALGPVPRGGAMGPIVSLYIRDPDGNLIEIGVPA